MISLSNILSVSLSKGKRLFKVFEFGAKTANEAAPFGDDASPLKDMRAVFANTSEVGEPVIIGYINSKQLAQLGEKRIYSLNKDGGLSIDLWLKNDGTMEIGGKTDNLIKYKPLEDALSKQDVDVNAELQKISLALSTLGVTYTVKSISTDISQSKSSILKTR